MSNLSAYQTARSHPIHINKRCHVHVLKGVRLCPHPMHMVGLLAMQTTKFGTLNILPAHIPDAGLAICNSWDADGNARAARFQTNWSSPPP
jgi:hypothetical protein